MMQTQLLTTTHSTEITAGNSAEMSRRDLVRPVSSLPVSLRPFLRPFHPSPFSLLHLESNLISLSNIFLQFTFNPRWCADPEKED